MSSNLQYDKFEISDTEIIQKLFMQAIYAGKTPTPESVLHANRIGLLDLAPPKTGQIIERIESVAFVFDESKPATDMPCIIDVAYRYRKPKDIPLAFPVARQAEKQWNTARIGTLLEQILDQLRISNTSSLRTDVLEPISKLAVQGITADAKELQDLTMELASVKSANAIYEVENGRLLATITEERNKHELELRKERAKVKSHKDSAWLPQAEKSENAEEAYKKVEEHDRYMARSILISARTLYISACHGLLEIPDYMLRFSHFKQKPAYVVNYIHAMSDALSLGLDQKKVTLQMVKGAKNNALQKDKHATIAVDEELGIDHTIHWNDLHPDIYEQYFFKLCAVYSHIPPELLNP